MSREGETEEDEDILSTATYILRPLAQDIPLSTEGQPDVADITCVELCEGNLYIGTSQAEILHFVSIPPDPSDDARVPTYIFASRLQPSYNAQAAVQHQHGVQQILVLPSVQKACVLCNGTLSFYTLPELSPAFGNTTVSNCTWVGGVDLNGEDEQQEHGIVIMICVKNKVRLVRVADEVRKVRDIQYPGCLKSMRRGEYACVADAHGYALLDVENQQKISLFPISSLDENLGAGKVEDVSGDLMPTRPGTTRPESSQGGHGRSTSLGNIVGNIGRRQASPRPSTRDNSGALTPEPVLEDSSKSRSSSHTRTESTPDSSISRNHTAATDKALPIPPRSDSLKHPQHRDQVLAPHICSPSATEFLLTTGTSKNESGVGLFVNLDGDVVRGTMEFSKYPSSIVIDPESSEHGNPSNNENSSGFVLATLPHSMRGVEGLAIEIQRWDDENAHETEWIEVPKVSRHSIDDESAQNESKYGHGLRSVTSAVPLHHSEVGDLLRAGRFRLSEGRESSQENAKQEAVRDNEEIAFGRRFGDSMTNILLWSDSGVWSVSRNPLVMRLDAALTRAFVRQPTQQRVILERNEVIRVVSTIRGQEPTTETEFLSLEYIRQKASIMLFADLVRRAASSDHIASADLRITESLLMEGGVDPRIILSLLPPLSEEVIEGEQGIWIHNGLLSVTKEFLYLVRGLTNPMGDKELQQLVKRYLTAWRQRKGFGSIADEREVFHTVDAALLQVLLIQDPNVRSHPSRPPPERQELYSFVDSGVDCFDRAVAILEQHSRLYTLSRLYQSRRLSRKVLETWQRIVEGDKDIDRGLVDGENEVRKYLTNVRDHSIVDEFGTWLAKRNPALGVQIFTNETSKVKWEPHQVLMLLRRRAPNAVKDYLEHLVFGKKNIQYANDLISYYLDNVLTVLGSSDTAKDQLAQTYEVYRALRPPKPTYREYITENALPESWWHDRLRLLELIGGSHGSDFAYDVQQVLDRIEPFEQDLVPESIILDGRQGRHKQALKLLTHGLGDYHTAVNYCLLGGASMFHPTQGTVPAPSHEEQSLLFNNVLNEFLRIEDVDDRLEQTRELLSRFSGWFDVRQVLELVPEDWSVEILSGFLISAFRQLVHEKNEVMIMKALSGAENLQVASTFIEKVREMGPQIDGGENTQGIT